MLARQSAGFLPIALALSTMTVGCRQGRKVGPAVVAQTSTASSADTYREIKPEDGVDFYSRSSSQELRADGNLYMEGFECGVIDGNGKEINIALLSTTVDRGLIRTKDLGVLKIQPSQSMGVKLLATESQIEILRSLQTSAR